MVGGGIAGILALQAAGAFDSYKQEEPSYTVKQHSYRGSSPTSSPYTCATACEFVCSTGCIGEDYEGRY
jgi:hypothetical protein